MDLNNFNYKLIVTGLAGLVEDDGLSPREAFEVLEDIKRNTFQALNEIKRREEQNR